MVFPYLMEFSSVGVMFLDNIHARSPFFHRCLTFRPFSLKGEDGYDECSFIL